MVTQPGQLMGIVAWRLFMITRVARTNPSLPCSQLLSELWTKRSPQTFHYPVHYAREIQIPSLTLIYPAIRPGHRLGLQQQPVPRLQDDVCFLGYPPAFAAVPHYLVHTLGVLHSTMPAADFRHAMGSPYGSLSLGALAK
jgi:hypothetical protein